MANIPELCMPSVLIAGPTKRKVGHAMTIYPYSFNFDPIISFEDGLFCFVYFI